MKVSVITPVYNAAEFVTRAVESALAQPETGEVLLIEDGSPDNSLAVCQALAEKYEKVSLLRHPNGENRGPGASRNLGMKNARYDYIGFVDADNFYLPDRFANTKKVFLNNPNCDGVYETIGNHIENDDGLHRWINSKRIPYKLTGLLNPVKPEDLAKKLIQGTSGSLTLDALVIKKHVLSESGLMSEHLRLHQDTDFIIRVSLVAKLLPADLSVPVALRGVHDHNRLSAPRPQNERYKNKMSFWLTLYKWSTNYSTKLIQREILKSIIRFNKSHKYFKRNPFPFLPVRLIWFTRLLRLLLYPKLFIAIVKISNLNIFDLEII